MLKNILGKKIQIIEELSDWEEAIRIGAEPLLEEGYIEKRYVDAMIQNVHHNGPYIVIMPLLAIPHARPESGVIKTGISLLKLNKPVLFPDQQKVFLLITLAANDSDIHLDIISRLADLLIDDTVFERLLGAESIEEVLKCL